MLVIMLLPSTSRSQAVASISDIHSGALIRYREQGRWTKATVTGASADSLTLMLHQRDSTTTLAFTSLADLQYSTGRKHELLKGTLGGAAVGGASGLLLGLLGQAAAEATWGSGATTEASVGEVTAIGAASGAVLGLVVAAMLPQRQWVTVQVPRAEPIVSAAPGGLTLGLRVRF